MKILKFVKVSEFVEIMSLYSNHVFVLDLQPVLPEYPYDYPYLVTMLAPLWPLDNCGVQPTDKLHGEHVCTEYSCLISGNMGYITVMEEEICLLRKIYFSE